MNMHEYKYSKSNKTKKEKFLMYGFIIVLILSVSCLIFILDKHKKKDKIEVYINHTKSRRRIMTAKDLQGNPVQIDDKVLEDLKKKYDVVIRVDDNEKN